MRNWRKQIKGKKISKRAKSDRFRGRKCSRKLAQVRPHRACTRANQQFFWSKWSFKVREKRVCSNSTQKAQTVSKSSKDRQKLEQSDPRMPAGRLVLIRIGKRAKSLLRGESLLSSRVRRSTKSGSRSERKAPRVRRYPDRHRNDRLHRLLATPNQSRRIECGLIDCYPFESERERERERGVSRAIWPASITNSKLSESVPAARQVQSESMEVAPHPAERKRVKIERNYFKAYMPWRTHQQIYWACWWRDYNRLPAPSWINNFRRNRKQDVKFRIQLSACAVQAVTLQRDRPASRIANCLENPTVSV